VRPHVAVLLVLVCAPSASAQQVRQPGDTLHLDAMHEAALRSDPRFEQLELQREQSELRLRSITAERLPSLALDGQAQYQSAVTKLPIVLPGGPSIPVPNKDTYDAHVGAQQTLLDPTLTARRAVERAQLAEAQSDVRAALFARKQEVNDAFFQAALLDARAGELAQVIGDLEARLHESEQRLRERAVLPSDAAALEAEIIQRRQDEAQLRADRHAALAILGELTGARIGEDVVVAVPDASTLVLPAANAAEVRARPEYERFARTRERLSQQEQVISSQLKPRVSAYGRLGYGRPGLNFLSTSFDAYWLAGVQVHWAPWNWGTSDRERQSLELQQRIVTTQEAAFSDGLRRAVQHDLTTIERLKAALQSDDRLVALREAIEHETLVRFRENVVTAADYINRRNDVLAARLARATHRVELAQASAHYLTTLGLEVGR
jgi:outer membrane protein TolC